MLHASFRPAADVFGELNRLQSVLDQVFRPLERSSIRALAGSAFPVSEWPHDPTTPGRGFAPPFGRYRLAVTRNPGRLSKITFSMV